MNKLISLIKTDFNMTFGITSILYSIRNRKNRWQLILFGIAFLSLIPSYVLLINALENIYISFEVLGQENYFLLMGFFAAIFLTFFLGLLYVMSKFYFSNDLVHLIPLPIKPSYIFTSKFIIVMISEYITLLPIILPFIFIYGIKGNLGFLYYLYSAMTILFIPMLPLVLASLLIMLLMKYTNIKGKRDLVRLISSLVMILLIVFLQMKLQQVMQEALMEGEEFYLNLARDANLLVKNMGRIFPPAMWASLALINYNNMNGLINLVLFLGTSMLAFQIMIIAAEKIFFQGLIGNTEVVSGKASGSRKISDRDFKVTKPYIALAKKEIAMLFKTPIYVMNSVGGVVLVPIIMFISLLSQEGTMDYMSQLIARNMDIFLLAAIAMIASLAILNSVGSTTFSREGNNFWIQRTLPISPETQIIGRILSSLFIQLIGALVLMVIIYFIIFLDIGYSFLIISLGLLASIPLIEMGMIIDIIRPMTNWTNPQQAMKQNLNVLIGMGLGLLYLGLLFLLTRSLFNKTNLYLLLLILIIVLIGSSIIFFIILRKLVEKQFQEIE